MKNTLKNVVESISMFFCKIGTLFKKIDYNFSKTNIGSKWHKVNKRSRNQTYVLLIFAVVVVILAATTGFDLFSKGNVNNILNRTIFYLTAGYGMMFIFGSGLLDLSIAANMAMSGAVGMLVGKQIGGVGGLIVMLLVIVLSSIIFGQISVQCALNLKIPAWVAGLGAGLILEAILNIWNNSSPLVKITGSGTKILRYFGSAPGMYIFAAVVIVLAFIIYNKTTLGINLQAVGGNAGVSKNTGINVKKTVILATIVGGAFVGFASFFNVSNQGYVSPSTNLASLSTIFNILAVVMLADALGNLFSQPISIIISAFIITLLLTLFKIWTGKTGTEADFFGGVLIIVAGIISRIGYKGVVK